MGTIAYNNEDIDLGFIFRATSGGTVFSANLANETTFDLFTDDAVENDAIYFAKNSFTGFSDLKFNIGTAMAGTDIVLVWEYYCGYTRTWRTMHNLTDNTDSFTKTGVNTVVFPYQARWYYTTVNGIDYVPFVRCRIVSLTTITEGGATQTSKVKCHTGVVSINNYTDANHCTWNDVYNWIVANAPQIGAYKWGTDTFKFDNCTFSINSTLRSLNEKVFIGNGSFSYGGLGIDYLWSGTKVGSNGWTDSSYLFCSFASPTNIISNSSHTRFYGGAINYFSSLVDGIPGTLSGLYGVSAGEFIGVYLRSTGYFNTGIIDRCIVDGGLITAAVVTRYPTNLQIANPKDSIWLMYGKGLDVSDISYTLPATSLFYFGQQYGAQGQLINIVNPNPSFPSQSSTPRIIVRDLGTLTNLTQCLFYDYDAGTYTDYLTQASSVDVDDVPINGDVGDCLYLLCPGVSANIYNPATSFTITSQTNDYVYAVEYYRSGVWYKIPSEIFWDTTDNFSKTGIIYWAIDGDYKWQQITINGITGYWLRIRIVTKGTGSPMISRIQSRAQSGICDLKVNEKYSTLLTVQDELGNPIEGASLVFTDIVGNQTILTTDINGKMPLTNFIASQTGFDKNTSEIDYNMKKTDYNPYTVIVTKVGYETYYNKRNITSKNITETITLKKAVPILLSDKGQVFMKKNKENQGNNRNFIIKL